tara:strand:+ start:6063 stop:7355 length:1293 start_codon:yes stop_codon:yes gene_type:complete
MDDFNKVGRLQRPQFLPSTRGFGLDGKEIIFKTPIKPKPYRKRRKRAKQGKIMFDNAQARWYRNQNLYGSQRGARIFRNSQNVGVNEDERGLSRPDLDRRIILQIERAEENRLDRDLERLEERLGAPQRILRRRPQPIPLDDGRIPIALPDRVLRDDALENNEARGVIAGLDVADPVVEPLLREADESVSSEDEEGLEEVLSRGKSDAPLVERGGEERYGLRNVKVRNLAESDQDSASSDEDFDAGNTTNPELLEQIRIDEEEQRQIAIRKEAQPRNRFDDDSSSVKKKGRRKPKVEISEFDKPEEYEGAGVGGNIGETVDASEREVRREVGNEPTLDDRADERKQSREGGNIVKRGLSRAKQSARDIFLSKGKEDKRGEVFLSPFDPRDIITTPLPNAVSDNAELGLNPQFVSNPLDDDTASEISLGED